MAGQVRDFDLDTFLSDSEDPDFPVPWALQSYERVEVGAVGSLSQVLARASPAVRNRDRSTSKFHKDISFLSLVHKCMVSTGIQPSTRVIYVCDYEEGEKRVEFTRKLWRELNRVLPSHEIRLAIAEGPFEDDRGVSSHFETSKYHAMKPTKASLALRADFHISCIRILRAIRSHGAQLVIARGQGAIAACGLIRGEVLEEVLRSRNMQADELHALAESWCGIKALILIQPRLSRSKGIEVDHIRVALPDLLHTESALRKTPTWFVHNRQTHNYANERAFINALGENSIDNMYDLPFSALLLVPSPQVWEHNLRCSCGKRCFLNNSYMECLRAEIDLKLLEMNERSREQVEEVPKDDMTIEVQEVATLHSSVNVVVLTESLVTRVVSVKPGDRPVWKYGPVHRQTWKHGISLPVSKKVQMPDLCLSNYWS